MASGPLKQALPYLDSVLAAYYNFHIMKRSMKPRRQFDRKYQVIGGALAAVLLFVLLILFLCLPKSQETGNLSDNQVFILDAPFTPLNISVVDMNVSQNITVSDNSAEGSNSQITPDNNMISNPSVSDNEIVENEYANFAIANVTNYVNVRNTPDTSGEIVGKMYDGSVAQILEVAGENGEWFRVISGNLEGYIKAEYFIYGEDALQVIDQYVTEYAFVNADLLYVREEPTTESSRIGFLGHEEEVLILEDLGEWLKVRYGEDSEGYICKQYTTIIESFIYAKTIEEEEAELAAQREQASRNEPQNQNVQENTTIVVTPPNSYTTNSELRAAIVNYALQFVGRPYVHGGNSLTNGTDCSGFTSLVFREFGYSLSRTPSGQLNGIGRTISYEEAQPGDILCYSSNGRTCTHVAIYIGNGQVVHAANSRAGIIVGNALSNPLIAVKNIID